MFDNLEAAPGSGQHQTHALVYEHYVSKRSNVYVGRYYIDLTGC